MTNRQAPWQLLLEQHRPWLRVRALWLQQPRESLPSLALQKQKQSPHPLLAVFDVADRNQCEVRTRRTNTPLQALVTLNEAGFAASAEALGRRARAAVDAEDAQLRWIWLACTGRVPEDDDVKLLARTLGDYRSISGNENQAWTALGNVLLNLDATLTLE